MYEFIAKCKQQKPLEEKTETESGEKFCEMFLKTVCVLNKMNKIQLFWMIRIYTPTNCNKLFSREKIEIESFFSELCENNLPEGVEWKQIKCRPNCAFSKLCKH